MFRKKSLLALLLSLCMVVGILPATVFAAGAGMPQNIRWAESPKSMVKPVLVCDFSEQIADSDIVSNVMDSN